MLPAASRIDSSLARHLYLAGKLLHMTKKIIESGFSSLDKSADWLTNVTMRKGQVFDVTRLVPVNLTYSVTLVYPFSDKPPETSEDARYLLAIGFEIWTSDND